MFTHRNIYKYTWHSPDGKTHNLIDHILIDRRFLDSFISTLSPYGTTSTCMILSVQTLYRLHMMSRVPVNTLHLYYYRVKFIL